MYTPKQKLTFRQTDFSHEKHAICPEKNLIQHTQSLVKLAYITLLILWLWYASSQSQGPKVGRCQGHSTGKKWAS